MLSTLIIYLGLLLSRPVFSSPSGPAAAVAETLPPDICKLRGSVYVTDKPNRAHYYVFVEDYESSADLTVYMEENKLYANQPGLWFFTDKEAFADFVVYFTGSKGMADFTIYYTDVASFAGCR